MVAPAKPARLRAARGLLVAFTSDTMAGWMAGWLRDNLQGDGFNDGEEHTWVSGELGRHCESLASAFGTGDTSSDIADEAA